MIQVMIIEIQYIKNHFVPLVRWNKLPINRIDTQAQIEEVLTDSIDTNQCHLIKKFKVEP